MQSWSHMPYWIQQGTSGYPVYPVATATAMDLRTVSLHSLLVLILTGASCLQGCREHTDGQLAPHKLKGSHQIMSPKAHGTCVAAPQNPLRWGVDHKRADEIGCFNRHFAEFPGSWESTKLPTEMANQSAVENSTIMFYDSVADLFLKPQAELGPTSTIECQWLSIL